MKPEELPIVIMGGLVFVVFVGGFIWFFLLRPFICQSLKGWFIDYDPQTDKYFVRRKFLGIKFLVINDWLWDNAKYGYESFEKAENEAKGALNRHYKDQAELERRTKNWKVKPKTFIDNREIKITVDLQAAKEHYEDLLREYNIQKE
jgi:hypothetical protein